MYLTYAYNAVLVYYSGTSVETIKPAHFFRTIIHIYPDIQLSSRRLPC